MPDEAPLLDVASAVAEGSTIDWDKVDRSSTDERERTVINELRILERIARAMRTDSVSFGDEPRPEMAHEPIEQWGHLRVIEKLGHGTYGEVYRAWDEKLECEVALKIAKPTGLPQAVDAANALKEARLLARVRHANVVRVYGADCHGDRFGVWMELVAGRTLEQVLVANGPMSAQEVTHIGVDLCHALAAVHRAGLLHRDVKATNVMREDGGRLVLMDFGTGRAFPTPDDPVRGFAGTPGYMAPELFFGEDPSAASDVYSVGVLLYHLVTGSHPVDVQGGLASVERAHQRKERRLLRDARPDLSSSFIDVIERALSFNPSERYATAGAFGNALAAAAGIAQPHIEPAPRPQPPSRPRWKLIVPAVAAGLVVLAIVARFVSSPDTAATPPISMASPIASEPAAPPAAGSGTTPETYRVEAAFYALRDGQRVRLSSGSRVAPGDKLFLNLDVSRPVFVYIVNQDDLGATHLLFPLPGQRATNPVSMGQKQLPGPGARDGNELYWEVTTAGGAEHFFVYVTPERQDDFEKLLAGIPRATLGREVTSAPLSREAVGVLRAVGGLTTAGTPGRSTATPLNGLAPLPAGPDSASGLWARQITLANPAK